MIFDYVWGVHESEGGGGAEMDGAKTVERAAAVGLAPGSGRPVALFGIAVAWAPSA